MRFSSASPLWVRPQGDSPPTCRGRHVEVTWRLIGDFRNLAVHNYFSVEWPLVWAMARSDVLRLLGQVTAILAEHYPGVLSVLDEP